MIKKIVFVNLFLAWTLSLNAQERIDLITLSGRYAQPQKYDSIYESKAKESGFMGSLVAPIKFSEKTIWYNSVNYFYWQVENNENPPSEIANPIQLHGFILRTGLYQKFSKKRGIQILIAPRFMSDFHNISSKHFQMGGLVMYEKEYSDDLKIGFGAMYNQEFFGPYLVPLLNLNWKLSERWSVTGLLPIYGKINYHVNSRLTAGLSHFGLITTYRLGQPEYKGDYIERKSIDESLFARYQLIDNIFIEGRLGYALGRSYAQYEADQKVDFSLPLIGFGDDRVQKNISFNDGLIASLRFVYSLPIE